MMPATQDGPTQQEQPMKLDDSRRSDNVEDGRGSSGLGGRSTGIGIGTIVVVVIGYFMGVSPATLLGLLGAGQDPVESSAPAVPVTGTSTDPQEDFVRAVLGETEDVWSAYFKERGQSYSPPKLRLFSGHVESACGRAGASAGPFYCPGDQKVYIDLSFYQQLATKFGAPGDFARAYVIAHEVGHHVQNLLGVSEAAERAQQRADRSGANHVSVELELQADCYAGVWAEQANSARKILEPGDLESGLQAASSVGDDTLQKRARGTVVPDSFTHGSSAQRVKWFRRGFEAGKIDNCDTFSAGAAL
jgi:predicted metalloprotease